MEYLLFTYPHCRDCEKLKAFLKEGDLEVREYDLTRKESKMKIREFLKDLKRDAKGAIIIPTLIASENDTTAAAVLNTPQELEEWLKSRD